MPDAARRTGEHRRLVHDEHGAPLGIGPQRETRLVVGVRTFAVDALVDRVRRGARVAAQHLGRTPRGRQQHAFHPQIAQCRNQRRDERGLARAGIAVQHENLRTILVGKVFGQPFYDFFLPGSCFETNFGVNLGRNTCTEHSVHFKFVQT